MMADWKEFDPNISSEEVLQQLKEIGSAYEETTGKLMPIDLIFQSISVLYLKQSLELLEEIRNLLNPQQSQET